MTNLNKLPTSVEQMSTSQEQKVVHIDEANFCLVHKPAPTETWKKLNEKFSQRREVEKEKLKLKTEKYDLVEQYDNLGKELGKVLAQPAKSVEEALEKQNKIKSIKEQMKKTREKILEKDKEIENKEKEIEKLDKDIVELAEKVREDEHEQNKQDKQRLDELNEGKIEDLKKELMAA